MSESTIAPRILVVDDECRLADTLAAILERAGYSSTAVYSPVEALAAVKTAPPELIISDVMMPVMNGVQFAGEADRLHPGIRILLISGHAGTQDLVEAARANGFSLDLLAKPVAPQELLAKVATILGDSSSAAKFS
jgi:CheY-like chemotaxis protein